MNPFKIIEKQKRLISNLKRDLSFSNDKVKDANTINTLIEVVDAFEAMLINVYYTEDLEKLMLFIFNRFLIDAVIDNVEGIPIHKIKREFDMLMKLSSKNYLEDVKQNLLVLEWNSVLQDEGLSDYHQRKYISDIARDSKDYDALIKEFMSNYKMDIYWNKKQNI